MRSGFKQLRLAIKGLIHFSKGGFTHTKLNWDLIFLYGLTMNILGVGNMTGRFLRTYHQPCTFYQKRLRIWYYIVTTPGKIVQCPLEGSEIDFSMQSFHRYSIFVVPRDEIMEGQICWGSVLRQKKKRAKEEDDLEESGDIPPAHHVNKYGINIIRGNNRVSKLFNSNYIEPNDAKIIFKLEGQEDTNSELVLEDRVHILKGVVRSNDGWWYVMEGKKSGDFLTDYQKNLVKQIIQFLCMVLYNALDFMNKKTWK